MIFVKNNSLLLLELTCLDRIVFKQHLAEHAHVFAIVYVHIKQMFIDIQCGLVSMKERASLMRS